MKKKNIIKIGIGVIVLILVVFCISVSLTIDKVGNYKAIKPYEELTFTEKVAAKVGGYEFYTKKELEDKGIIFTEEKKEAKKILEIFGDIPNLIGTKDGENTDTKIKECETVLDNLHEENSSGRVKGENLINLIDDCMDMTQHYKLALEAYKKLDVDSYKSYNDKAVGEFNKINSDMDRLGFKTK